MKHQVRNIDSEVRNETPSRCSISSASERRALGSSQKRAERPSVTSRNDRQQQLRLLRSAEEAATAATAGATGSAQLRRRRSRAAGGRQGGSESAMMRGRGNK